MTPILIEKDSKRFACIQAIAEKTWPVAYGEILSDQQMRYMLDRSYSIASLEKQTSRDHHRFLLASIGPVAVGFASYSSMQDQPERFRLHKLYVLPEEQGKGIGKLLLHEITRLISNEHPCMLELNVNRFNDARKFYERLGFQIVRQEDIDIGQGFFMNDFVMEKKIDELK